MHLQHRDPTHKEKLQQLDPSLIFALEAYPEHAFQVPFLDDIRFWLDDDGPARAPSSQAPPTAPSASSSAIHQRDLAQEGQTDSEVTSGSASASSQRVPTPRTRRKRTPGPFIDSDHPRATTRPHPVTESNLLSPALALESIKAPLFAPQRPSKKKTRSGLRRAQGPTPGVAKRTRHDGTLVPAYPCARCVEKDLECLICYVGGACNTCRAVARKCDVVDQKNKYDGSISRKRT
ncbi:hypothetical protein EXIGLDRAFT_728134 [Exidia glandulosa HHB12029]|uniref:Uncharacterized protein n=1 Tax=Exidia glandulosa HHB12029 TaxID=1314781 RepID=A0A165LVW5_EXIGL|nr:hypothetical protein EXIGLDRAFT_728134 [Exidia glandulosa HHB12029]